MTISNLRKSINYTFNNLTNKIVLRTSDNKKLNSIMNKYLENYKTSKYIPIEKTEDQDELEEYFVGKNFIEIVEDAKANPWVIKYSDTEEIIISLPDSIVIDGENVYIHFKYNGYNYILTADNQTAYIKALELDKDNIIIKLEVVGAEVIGNEREGWGITFNNTNNKYTLNSDFSLLCVVFI